ncbi:MAG: glycoside hydrolase family 88 protein [Acholeplasmatales bacterium]|nr:glycoside hydrolase family 88 protein [Acholeplasmatales bacterium]
MTYEDGLLLINAMNYYNYTKDDFYLNACIRYLDKTIAEDGSIRSYVLEDYNIDNILAGNVLFDVYEITKNNKYKTAISRLYSQLKTHPRTSDGSFWHKKRYPNQIWLDGLYMGQLFYLRAAKFLGEDVTSDSFKQFMNVKKYLLNEENGLYYHAYDETKTMQWASKVDGKSPNVWSRSIGWWLMAIVDCYKYFNKEQQAELKTIFKQAIDSILPHLDSVYNMMYQIVDKPSLNGNYLETSGSSMFAYSILKAVQDGILDSSYYEYGYKTIVGIDKKYLTEVSGEYILDGICKVAGLDNQARDGSEKYYLSEPISKNEIKGLSPYFNACLLIIKHNK